MDKIKNTLIQALDGDRRSINRMFGQFRSMALAYLKTKAKKNHLLLDLLYKNLEDLATDCIADLFKNEGGALTQLNTYFDGIELGEVDEAELMTHTRRLIFSKVSEGLYRNYKSFDPSLSKIIRNLKRTLEEEKVEGIRYNSSRSAIEVFPQKRNLPEMPEELIEVRLSTKVADIQHTVDAVEQLKEILNNEPGYRSSVSLVAFAIILRKIFANQLEFEKPQKLIQIKKYTPDEIRTFISKSIQSQLKQLQNTYIKSGKVTTYNFNRYMEVVAAQLESEFVEESPLEGYFEHFSFFFPEITYERYRAHHRKIIEYIIKQLREDVIRRIKKEEYFSRIDKV